MLNLQVTVVFLLLGLSQGFFVQLNNSLEVCPTDEAVFSCSGGGQFLQWEIQSEITSRPANIFFSSATTNFKIVTLGISRIEAHLIYLNDSFFNGTLTIMMATRLNRTTVRCNNDVLSLSLATTDIKFSSASFRLQSLTDDVGFFVFKFEVSPYLTITETYVVDISPPPPIGAPTVITASSTAILDLLKNVLYNITVHFQACPERFISTITFGRCLFIPSSATTEVEYIINSTDALFVLINCTDQNANKTSHVIECGMSGQWNEPVTNVCEDPSAEVLILSTNDIETEVRTSIMTCINPGTTLLSEPAQFSTRVLVIVIPITATGVCAVLVCFLGVIVGIKLKISKKGKVRTGNEAVSGSTLDPIYDEINVKDDNTAAIGLSNNIAYEEFKKFAS